MPSWPTPPWIAVIGTLVSGILPAQFIGSETAIPRTQKLPVVFVNGYQMECPPVSGDLNQFRATFGIADEILQRNGQATLFFDSCSIPNRPAIEVLGRAFGEFLTRLRYADGQQVPQVDVVAHSMGGLIVRSYLSGKQPDEAVFLPPADPRIRKLVFLGTPHFGTPIVALSTDRNKQIEQLETGSRFVFDLATWNQGIDDLRGVDAIAVLGNAGNGTLNSPARFDDSTVRLTSGSLEFVVPARTRILNFCHTGGLASLLCSNDEGRLAAMTADTHNSARIITSFLNGTDDWRAIGQAPGENLFLASRGGVAIIWKDANDGAFSLQSAMAGQDRLTIRSGQIGSNDFLQAQSLPLTMTNTAGGNASFTVPVSAGATRALTLKAGPSIAAVYPSFAVVFPRSVSPGAFISIYGNDLATTTAQAMGLPYPTVLGTTEVRLNGALLPLHYAGPSQINAVLPESATGLTKLVVKSAAGEHTVNVLVEPAVPTVFGTALNALSSALITVESPLRPGDYVSLFATGLGATVRRDGVDWAAIAPQVTVGGKLCELLYAGRAPGYVGLDQINCRLASDLTANNATPVVVRSGNRVSNTVNLPVR